MGEDATEIPGKEELKKGIRYHQASQVNELRWCVERISGFSQTTKGFWLIFQMAHFIRSRLAGRYITNMLLARVSWMVVQLLCGFVLYRKDAADARRDPGVETDEDVLDILRSYLASILGNGTDFDSFKGQLFRSNPGKHLGTKHYPGVEKYLTSDALRHYPALPSRRTINHLAGIMTIMDCYDRGFYTNIWKMWALIDSKEKVELKQRVPRAIALQFRLMSLFCNGRPADMLSICVLFCWERLGRLLLRQSKSTAGLSEIFDILATDLIFEDPDKGSDD